MTDIQVTQGYVLAAIESAAEAVDVTQGYVQAAVESQMNINVFQSYVLVAVRFRPYDPTVRAWTFTLDGHDFYVIRLGEFETLIYDTHAEEWYQWGSGETDLWAVLDGVNWDGGHNYSGAFGSNVLAGSDSNGALFLLDPEGTDDESAVDGSGTLEPFIRIAMAQYFMRGYDEIPCYGVELEGSIGDVRSPNPTDVTLFISDDRGDTYFECDTISIAADDLTARVNWTSLGSMAAPGRLFKVVDYGALHRIDLLEMQGPGDDA